MTTRLLEPIVYEFGVRGGGGGGGIGGVGGGQKEADQVAGG